jgi:hypothetical protein
MCKRSTCRLGSRRRETLRLRHPYSSPVANKPSSWAARPFQRKPMACRQPGDPQRSSTPPTLRQGAHQESRLAISALAYVPETAARNPLAHFPSRSTPPHTGQRSTSPSRTEHGHMLSRSSRPSRYSRFYSSGIRVGSYGPRMVAIDSNVRPAAPRARVLLAKSHPCRRFTTAEGFCLRLSKCADFDGDSARRTQTGLHPAA